MGISHSIKSRESPWDFCFGGFFRDGLVGSPRGVHGICKTKIWKILAEMSNTQFESPKQELLVFHAL